MACVGRPCVPVVPGRVLHAGHLEAIRLLSSASPVAVWEQFTVVWCRPDWTAHPRWPSLNRSRRLRPELLMRRGSLAARVLPTQPR